MAVTGSRFLLLLFVLTSGPGASANWCLEKGHLCVKLDGQNLTLESATVGPESEVVLIAEEMPEKGWHNWTVRLTQTDKRYDDAKIMLMTESGWTTTLHFYLPARSKKVDMRYSLPNVRGNVPPVTPSEDHSLIPQYSASPFFYHFISNSDFSSIVKLEEETLSVKVHVRHGQQNFYGLSDLEHLFHIQDKQVATTMTSPDPSSSTPSAESWPTWKTALVVIALLISMPAVLFALLLLIRWHKQAKRGRTAEEEGKRSLAIVPMDQFSEATAATIKKDLVSNKKNWASFGKNKKKPSVGLIAAKPSADPPVVTAAATVTAVKQ